MRQPHRQLSVQEAGHLDVHALRISEVILYRRTPVKGLF
jgi:hypothetical protein